MVLTDRANPDIVGGRFGEQPPPPKGKYFYCMAVNFIGNFTHLRSEYAAKSVDLLYFQMLVIDEFHPWTRPCSLD